VHDERISVEEERKRQLWTKEETFASPPECLPLPSYSRLPREFRCRARGHSEREREKESRLGG